MKKILLLILFGIIFAIGGCSEVETENTIETPEAAEPKAPSEEAEVPAEQASESEASEESTTEDAVEAESEEEVIEEVIEVESEEAAIEEEAVQAEEVEEEISNVVELTIDSFNFGYSQEEIRVKVGDTVKLTLTNSGGRHDFVIDELDVATSIISSGDTDEIEFTVTEPGEYYYYCSVGSHRAAGMEGLLIVE